MHGIYTSTERVLALSMTKRTFSSCIEVKFENEPRIVLDTHFIHMPEIGSRDEFRPNRPPIDRETYSVKKLNKKQKIFYDYVITHREEITVLDADPGCGKSFVLNAISHNNPDMNIEAIIFKNDLLDAYTANNVRHFSVAKFMMLFFEIGYYNYEALEMEIASKFNSFEFISVVISLLRAARVPNFKGSLVFLDEYTMIPQPLLFVLLLMFKHYKIGAVVCGDKKQFQSIHNSEHSKLSSFDLACLFSSSPPFTLSKNERCSNAAYNDIIKFISRFSCNRKLDDFAFALIAAIYPKQLFREAEYNQIHLAGTYQELSTLIHALMCDEKKRYDWSFYAIDQKNLRKRKGDVARKAQMQQTPSYHDYLMQYQKCQKEIKEGKRTKIEITVGPFLSYLPLVPNGLFYVNYYSEHKKGFLVKYDKNRQVVTMRMEKDNKLVEVKKNSNDWVMFEKHKRYLLKDGKNVIPGRLHNFSIYPANSMSFHKVQGCTISNQPLDLNFTNTKYQGWYVAASRVTDPNQICRVVIPNQQSFIVSAIINFPCMTTRPVTSKDLEKTVKNYIMVDIKELNLKRQCGELAKNFVMSDDPVYKKEIRKTLIGLTKNCPQIILNNQESVDEDTSLYTLSKLVKYQDLMLALAQLDHIDSFVWLHEFLLICPDMAHLLPKNLQKNSKTMENFVKREHNFLVGFSHINESYSLDISSESFIDHIAETEIRTSETDQKTNESKRIKVIELNVFRETKSEFCAKVYRHYQKKKAITMDWLMNELNILLRTCEPSGKVNGKMRID